MEGNANAVPDAVPQFDTLVIDTNAIINKELNDLVSKCRSFVTIPEVLQEVKNKAQGEWLQSAPFEIKLRTPSLTCFKRVVEHAKKTGDFPVLSKVDLLVMALTLTISEEFDEKNKRSSDVTNSQQSLDEFYAMESESNRKANAILPPPVLQSGVSWAKAIASNSNSTDEVVAVEMDRDSQEEEEEEEGLEEEELEEGDEDDDDELPEEFRVGDREVVDFNAISQNVENLNLADDASFPSLPQLPPPKIKEKDNDNSTTRTSSNSNQTSKVPNQEENAVIDSASPELEFDETPAQTLPPPSSKTGTSRIIGFNTTTTVRLDDSDWQEDDQDTWAKPGDALSSTSGWMESGSGKKKPNQNLPPPVRVACVTADFAMQNVLLHMKLGVIAKDGRRVTRLTHWVLKCDACFKTTAADTARKFCPYCGNATLARLAFSVSANGEVKYHLKKNRRTKTMGTKYSIPRNADVLLREDQLLYGKWGQRAKTKKSTVSMFGIDVNDSMNLQTSKKASATSNELPFGFGKTNPNAVKGRERRGAKKRKPKA